MSNDRAAPFDGVTFVVVRNDGPGAAVDRSTVFQYRQQGELIEAEYAGGGVRLGRLVGVLNGETITHAYVQVNLANEVQSGRSTVEVRRLADGRLQLIDSWQWQDRDGTGQCVMEERR